MTAGLKKIKEYRVLVVDDEYDISLAMKVVLEQNGFIVDSFNDASQAMSRCRRWMDLAYMRKLKNWMIRLQSVF